VQSFGSYLRTILDQRGMSGNQLAKAAGVTEGTIRNLLKQGEDPSVSSPHPLVLRAVCEALDLDHIRVLQMVEYIPAAYQPTALTPLAEVVGVQFDQLSAEGQRVVLSVLASLAATDGLTSDTIHTLAQAVRDLRRAHPMFIERRFDVRDALGRVVGNVFGMYATPHLLHSLESRLSELFREDPSITISQERIQAVAANAHARVVLNLLLPRKDIADPIEKLYWLVFPNDTYGTPEQEISEVQREGIRAFWHLLEKLS
jgi:transcriptional regulator with XRE-family HTH domain